MERLRVGVRASSDKLNKEGAKGIGFLRFCNCGKFGIVSGHNLPVFDDDVLALIFLDQFILMVKIEPKFILK
jgi:hypothetical protein